MPTGGAGTTGDPATTGTTAGTTAAPAVGSPRAASSSAGGTFALGQGMDPSTGEPTEGGAATASSSALLDASARAIAATESGGTRDPYQAVGPTTKRGDNAYGKYQVMGANIGPWSEKHLGQRLTKEEFLANPQAQEAVFRGEFGGYLDQYGNIRDAASKWFTGRPYAQASRSGASDGYNTVDQYVTKVQRALGTPAPGPAPAPTASFAPTVAPAPSPEARAAVTAPQGAMPTQAPAAPYTPDPYRVRPGQGGPTADYPRPPGPQAGAPAQAPPLQAQTQQAAQAGQQAQQQQGPQAQQALQQAQILADVEQGEQQAQARLAAERQVAPVRLAALGGGPGISPSPGVNISEGMPGMGGGQRAPPGQFERIFTEPQPQEDEAAQRAKWDAAQAEGQRLVQGVRQANPQYAALPPPGATVPPPTPALRPPPPAPTGSTAGPTAVPPASPAPAVAPVRVAQAGGGMPQQRAVAPVDPVAERMLLGMLSRARTQQEVMAIGQELLKLRQGQKPSIHSSEGRLFEYDPNTRQARELAGGTKGAQTVEIEVGGNKQRFQWNERTQRYDIPVGGGPAAGPVVPSKEVREAERTLYNDFEGTQTVKKYRELEQGVQGLKAAFSEGNATADLVAVIQLFKTIDPTSTVSARRARASRTRPACLRCCARSTTRALGKAGSSRRACGQRSSTPRSGCSRTGSARSRSRPRAIADAPRPTGSILIGRSRSSRSSSSGPSRMHFPDYSKSEDRRARARACRRRARRKQHRLMCRPSEQPRPCRWGRTSACPMAAPE